MAQLEADKEDLIREASALVDRFEFGSVPPGDPKTAPTGASPQTVDSDGSDRIVAGYRRNDSFSIYFGQNPFYQFTSDLGLRRAWEDGFLFRSEGTTLARLQRRRSASVTQLVRTDLDAVQLDEFQRRMTQRLQQFETQLRDGHSKVLRSVSETGRTAADVLASLTAILQKPAPFLAPRIGVR